MKKVLLTGKTGFIGRNILPFLTEKYDVDAPSRQELDLLDEDAVTGYVDKKNYDIILNMATPNPVKNPLHDNSSKMLRDSISIFLNFQRVSNSFGKMIYAGSGAEFNKKLDICSIKEDDFGRSIPEDDYGFAKYVMNEISAKSDNIYNLRLFAVYGPYDHESKFITHAINCCLRNEPVTIRKDCRFNYLHINDVVKFLSFLIENEVKHHDYNCCSGEHLLLSEIAKEVCKQMSTDYEVNILSPDLNNEYTGSCARFLSEYSGDMEFTSLSKGIEMQIEFMKGL